MKIIQWSKRKGDTIMNKDIQSTTQKTKDFSNTNPNKHWDELRKGMYIIIIEK